MFKSPLAGAARRTIAEPQIVAMLLIRNWPFELRRGDRARSEAEIRAVLERLVALGLPCERDAGGGRLFDIAEVTNFLIWAGIHLGDPTLERQVVATARRLIREPHGRAWDDGADAPPDEVLGPRRFAVTLRRQFNLAGYVPGRRLRLRLPVPVEDAVLGDLSVDFLPPTGIEVETSTGPGRVDFIMAVPSEPEVTVGIAMTFTARPSPVPGVPEDLSPEERELYTRPHEGLLRTSPRIEALAHRIAEGAASAEATVARFWDFFLREFAIGYVHYDLLDREWPLDTALDSGWFDCVVGSTLLVAMCRVRGIPARIVSGYFLYPSTPSYHTWFEVWFDRTGWQPIDLFGWGLTMDRSQSGDWREYFYGWIDYRMVIERPPLLFAGTGGVRVPRAWDMLCSAEGKGSALEIREAGSDIVVYREYSEVSVISDRG